MYIKTIKKGCPICKGDVKGNYTHRYLCLKCNVSFKYIHLDSKDVEKVETDNPRLNWKEQEKNFK